MLARAVFSLHSTFLVVYPSDSVSSIALWGSPEKMRAFIILFSIRSCFALFVFAFVFSYLSEV